MTSHLLRKSLLAAFGLALLGAWAPTGAAAQELPEFELDGLLRTGLRLESSRYDGVSGFEIYDARLGLSGKVGIVFDYALRAEYQFEIDAVRLLDVLLSVPLSLIPLVERSQGSLAIAPGRQVGAALRGVALEERLKYRGGLYNGEGATFGNDDRRFLFAGRVEYNSAGEVEFFEDFVYEFGVDVAFASDSANLVLPVSRPAGDEEGTGAGIPGYTEFTGDRLAWSADVGLRYRTWSFAGEYARAEYDPSGNADKLSSDAWYVQGGYSLWGAFDLLARYDSFETAAGLGTDADRTQFLVFGFNLNPGFHAKMGLQYAIGLDNSLVGVSQAIDHTNTGPALADNQFLLNLQVSF